MCAETSQLFPWMPWSAHTPISNIISWHTNIQTAFVSTLSASPNSLKCNISMNNFLNRRIHMFGEYGTYGKIRAIKGTYDQIVLIKSN